MNTETKEKLLRVLGWEELYEDQWYAPFLARPATTDQALAHAESMKAAMEFMGRSARNWVYHAFKKKWLGVHPITGQLHMKASGDTQQEAILAGVVAWCELNDGWDEALAPIGDNHG